MPDFSLDEVFGLPRHRNQRVAIEADGIMCEIAISPVYEAAERLDCHNNSFLGGRILRLNPAPLRPQLSL